MLIRKIKKRKRKRTSYRLEDNEGVNVSQVMTKSVNVVNVGSQSMAEYLKYASEKDHFTATAMG